MAGAVDDSPPAEPPHLSAMPMALRGVAAGALALALLLLLGLAVDHWPFAWDRAILTGCAPMRSPRGCARRRWISPHWAACRYWS